MCWSNPAAECEPGRPPSLSGQPIDSLVTTELSQFPHFFLTELAGMCVCKQYGPQRTGRVTKLGICRGSIYREGGMATKKQPEKAKAATAKNALAKLKADHATVKKLFARYEKSKDQLSTREKSELVGEICGELKVHAQIEEEIFYPAVRSVQDKDLTELLDEAEVEHAGAKNLIAQLEGAKPSERLYDAKVTVLGENIKHHAGEEENEMFPKVKATKGLNLIELGAALEQRANQLKTKLGLK